MNNQLVTEVLHCTSICHIYHASWVKKNMFTDMTTVVLVSTLSKKKSGLFNVRSWLCEPARLRITYCHGLNSACIVWQLMGLMLIAVSCPPVYCLGVCSSCVLWLSFFIGGIRKFTVVLMGAVDALLAASMGAASRPIQWQETLKKVSSSLTNVKQAK